MSMKSHLLSLRFKFLRAFITFVRTNMCFDVVAQLYTLDKAFPAFTAFIRPFSGMTFHMPIQNLFHGK